MLFVRVAKLGVPPVPVVSGIPVGCKGVVVMVVVVVVVVAHVVDVCGTAIWRLAVLVSLAG